MSQSAELRPQGCWGMPSTASDTLSPEFVTCQHSSRLDAHLPPCPCPCLTFLQVERETQLQQLSAVLGSLWEALTVAPSAPERASVSELIQGPTKLQAATFEAVGCFLLSALHQKGGSEVRAATIGAVWCVALAGADQAAGGDY